MSDRSHEIWGKSPLDSPSVIEAIKSQIANSKFSPNYIAYRDKENRLVELIQSNFKKDDKAK